MFVIKMIIMCYGGRKNILGWNYLFPRGRWIPRARSSLLRIWGFGIAWPDSYCWMTCGFSLIAVASCFWVSFFARRACWIAWLRDLSTVACLNSSVSFSRRAAAAPCGAWALLFSPPFAEIKVMKMKEYHMNITFSLALNLSSSFGLSYHLCAAHSCSSRTCTLLDYNY